MKLARPALIIAVLGLVGCPPPRPDDATPAAVVATDPQAKQAHPNASCGYCADTAGRNDVKHLCSASAVAWDDLVACICDDACVDVCGDDWCARLGDLHYVNASDDCNGCAVALCSAELSACSSAQ